MESPIEHGRLLNLHFKNYILDKDINKKILTENPVPLNPQEVPVLDDFVKTPLVLHTVITTDHQMEKFQEKILQVMGPYHNSGKDWKMFKTSLPKLLKYL